VGKNKLARWNEILTFSNVIQPPADDVKGIDHPLKGRWRPVFFRNENGIILELGCGRGEYTIGLAEKFPDRNFIGADIKGARLWRGAKTATERHIPNAGFLRTRIEFISSFFAADEVDEIWLTFPDPFPKIRDENKRLSSPWFLNLYRMFLKDMGIIHLKTDNRNLFNYTCKMVKANKLEIISEIADIRAENSGNNLLAIETHYEKLFRKEGMTISYLSFRLEKNRIIIYEKES
jgi:tRNA (guanine-N7-)-methyltransferase